MVRPKNHALNSNLGVRSGTEIWLVAAKRALQVGRGQYALRQLIWKGRDVTDRSKKIEKASR